MSRARNRVVPAATAILFASCAWITVPQLIEIMRAAAGLKGKTLHQRRTDIFNQSYFFARALRDSDVPVAPVALVPVDGRPETIDLMVFCNYYLFPRETRLAYGYAGYRTMPVLPRSIVRIDASAAEQYKLTSFDGLREEFLRKGPVTWRLPVNEIEPRTSFVVPLVGSADGPAPQTFVTEAAFHNPGPHPVTVRLDLYPHTKAKELTLTAGQTIRAYDLVSEYFAVRGVGWLRVTTSVPIGVRFWLVNRGPDVAAAIPPVAEPQRATATVAAPRGAKLWLLNATDRSAQIVVSGQTHSIPARAIESRNVDGPVTVESTAAVFAFASRLERNGQTTFVWPPEVR